ncbi:MAG: acyl-CoA dehydrogenase [Chloroflexi bacterium]|nr:MAG: acyl-CoA dehydrogenase [Chloroflexota bacterium]TMD52963.1 MAG: acyl-CoA dehydrogenase [Chloroflexota bacterium]
MNFELSEEQKQVRDLCHEFADEVVAPAAEELDREHRFGYDVVRQMAELGLFGLPFPEEVGGQGGDFLSYCIAIEEISRADAGIGITLEAAVSLGAAPIFNFGTKEQKRDHLPDLLAGRKLWAFGLTEPDAGSDAGGTRTRAELEDGHWVINGRKQFITNSGTDITAGVTITALTARSAGARGEISAVMVPQGTPGYTVEKPYRKLGWHSSDTHPLTFQDCRVPEENILGRRGGGYRQFLHTLAGGRVAIAALSVGLAQACFDAALAYAKERKQFGKPISSFQAIQFKLADMATELELARTITYKAACAYTYTGESSPEFRKLAAIAKLYASETSKRAADQAVQIHGGNGFMEEYPVARYWRDVKVNEIGEGTSEVQRMLIARELGI